MRKIIAMGSFVGMAVLVLARLTAGDPLAAFTNALFSAKSLTTTYTVQKIGDSSRTYTVTLEKPNRARIESPAQIIVADGTSILTFDKAGKTYDKRLQTDADLKALFNGDDLTLLASFFDSSFSSRFNSIAAAGKKVRRNVNYDVVTASLVSPKRAFTFYLDPVDKIAKIAEITPDGGTDTTIVASKELVCGGEVPPNTFAFTIPAGALNISADAPYKVPRSQMPNLIGYEVLPNLQPCCPTATADGLLWLGMNGFPGLVPEGLSEKDQGQALATELASYYKTDNTIGTPWDRMFNGLPLFLKDHGYPRSTLSLYAWTKFPEGDRISVGTEIPSLETMRKGNTRSSFVMIALGWFKKPDANGKAARVNWHWATMVEAEPDSGYITLHDPFQVNGRPRGPLRLRVTRMSDSSNVSLLGSAQFKEPDKKGAGVPVVENYPNVKSDEFAVIEGVLIVKLAK